MGIDARGSGIGVWDFRLGGYGRNGDGFWQIQSVCKSRSSGDVLK